MRATLPRLREAANLSWSLARASFLLRNEGSYLGLLWYLLTPLATFAVILFVKQQAFANVGIQSYPVYLLVGILLHHFFSRAVGDAATVVSGNAGLLKSTRVPREALVASRLIQAALAHAIEVAVLLLLVLGSAVLVPGLAVYAAAFGLFAVFTLGVSFVVATVGAYAHDLRNVWAVASQLLFFVTPIFHAPTPGSALEAVNRWNPLALAIDAARAGLIDGRVPDAATWATLVSWAVLSLAVGLLVFGARKRRLAELV